MKILIREFQVVVMVVTAVVELQQLQVALSPHPVLPWFRWTQHVQKRLHVVLRRVVERGVEREVEQVADQQ